MKKNDWLGLGISLLLHGGLLVLFALVTMASVEQQALGYIEVDFGPLAEGRPVQRVEATRPDVPEEPAEPEPEPEEQAAPPEVARPVDLPDEAVADEEQVEAPETETISPEQQNNPAEVDEPEPQPESRPVRPLGGGAETGTSGAAEGAEGSGAEEERTAPYQIEGLNRVPLNAPLPGYAEKVNATIRIRITVDPQGRVMQRIPLLKGNPALEQAVMDALQRWRFNPLPANVPQDPQTGTITFRFRLE